ncbi:hypothetical protein GCM10023205_15160 [Yinghuangia aomiensis]|uniref:Uncharacterized protein n=1 Tax=Yinghuangia aomiensis TaxID=676205 RepID=A0ABP9GVB4_9ACTN
MTRVYQALLRGSGDHLGPALRRSFTAVFGTADDPVDDWRPVLGDGPSYGRYAAARDTARVTVFWGRSGPAEAWAVVAVDGTDPDPDAADQARAVDMIAGLLDAERAFDGTIPLETTPAEIDADGVGGLLRWLFDARRRVPVIVQSVDERDPARPARHAAALARATAGTAVVALLADKPTQDHLNAALGDAFGVYGGALRTYLAGLAPATEDHPLRHPVRSGSALRDAGVRALDVVVTGVVGDGVRRPLPADVRRGLRTIGELFDGGRARREDGEGAAEHQGAATGSGPGRPRPGNGAQGGAATVPALCPACGKSDPPAPNAAGPTAPRSLPAQPGRPTPAAFPRPTPAVVAAKRPPRAHPGPSTTAPAPPGAGGPPEAASDFCPLCHAPGSSGSTAPDRARPVPPPAGTAHHPTARALSSPGPALRSAPVVPAAQPAKSTPASPPALPRPTPAWLAPAPSLPPPDDSPGTPLAALLGAEVADRVVAALRDGGLLTPDLPRRVATEPDVAELRRALADLRELRPLIAELRAIASRFDRAAGPGDDAESEALAAELAELREDYGTLALQYEELADEARRSEARIRRLDGLLAELSAGAHEIPESEVWIPECLSDVLLKARGQLPYVDLPDSLDAGAALLDKAEPGHTRVWAGAAWDALRALNAYAAARSSNTFRGGFRDWCRNPPHGQYAISPKKFAMKESDAVGGRPKFRKARTFPVPADVSPDGHVFMEAHVKLRGIGNPAPRMHFHDDAAGTTGRIWVGYLGHHLDNTRTN